VCSLAGPARLVQDWLLSPDISAQLSAAGYNTDLLLLVGDAFLAGTMHLKGVAAAGNSSAAESLSKKLTESLEAYGSALTGLCHTRCLQQPQLSQPQWSYRAERGEWSQLQVCWLPHRLLLQHTLSAESASALEAAQASVQGIGKSSSCSCRSA